jgi:hypothetical protein
MVPASARLATHDLLFSLDLHAALCTITQYQIANVSTWHKLLQNRMHWQRTQQNADSSWIFLTLL